MSLGQYSKQLGQSAGIAGHTLPPISNDQKASVVVKGQREPHAGSTMDSSDVRPYYHGCQGLLWVKSSPRALGENTVPKISQLKEVASHLGSAKGIRQRPKKSPCTSPLGQCGSSLLFKQGGTRCLALIRLASAIFSWAERNLKSISAIHLKGADNHLAAF